MTKTAIPAPLPLLLLLLLAGIACHDATTVSGPSNPAPVLGLRPAAASLQATTVGLSPIVTENGQVSLSVDGLGTNAASGVIQVEKPAGATVRAAYLAAASTGFSAHTLVDDEITLDGAGVSFERVVTGAIDNSNGWANVTSLVKSRIDAAPAGRVDITVAESGTTNIDGEILAVIFDDPARTADNTVVLFFGAQQVAGDDFSINLAEPLDTSNPDLVLDLGLGISFGCQRTGFCGPNQRSIIDVNGQRLTSTAGGEDDGSSENGALLTVGGLDDGDTNPSDPNAAPNGDPRQDDELYSLLPFVSTGDQSIALHTQNPSNDDNIYFASLFTTVIAAVDTVPTSPPFTQTVGSAGGTICAVECKLSIVIPAGALASDVTFTIRHTPSPVADPRLVERSACDIEPADAQFLRPIEIGIQYDPSTLARGVTEESLRLFQLVNGAWVQVPGSGVNTSTHVAWGVTTSVGTFAVLGT